MAGLSAAYDRYAASLYGYCHSLLVYPADAADAVHDTFIVAWTKILCLREPDRLRAWLFAIARHECHSRPRSGAVPAPGTDPVQAISHGDDAPVGDAELQYLVQAALTGLEPAERELIELNLRCELEAADLADILGVPRGQAQTMATRACSRFTKLLDMLLAAWSARGQCPGAAVLLDDWDGTLTTALSKRLASHIRRCSVCGRIKHRDIRAMMLTLLPAAVPPDRLRERVVGLVTDRAPDAEDRRQRIARRAEPLASSGFPVQATRPSAPRLPASYVRAGIAAAAAITLLGGGAFLLVNYNSSHSGQSPASGALVPTGSTVPASALTIAPPASSSRARSSSPAPSLAPVSAISPLPETLAPTTQVPTSKASTSRAPTKSPSPTPSKTPTPTPSRTPTPTPTPTSTASPTPTSTASPTATSTTAAAALLDVGASPGNVNASIWLTLPAA